MQNFLGIDNVIDAKAIIGEDGCTDGFDIIYLRPKTVTNKRTHKTYTRMVEAKKTVYVREFNPNSVKTDGSIHGFGKGTMYTTKVSKPKVKKAKKVVNYSKIFKVVNGVVVLNK